MKRLNKNGLFSLLITLIVVIFLSSATVSAARPERVRTTLAIGKNKFTLSPLFEPHSRILGITEVGSSATRLSVVVGDNGKPKIMSIGPGTRSKTGPLESNWTTEGFLLIKDGTDEALLCTHPIHFST
ncbi:MAG: hypothetical protein JOS17DRAFT_555095 [Linnemannia elongata]|nr:MAG: hypothetical protein JOS17DRAFT_555095 [Linnemannia elongata]